MVTVEPIPDVPAARTRIDGEQTLLIADFHAGYEAHIRYDQGLNIESRADRRRDRLLSLIERIGATRLIILGDVMHSIGGPGGVERRELTALMSALPNALSVTLVRGNHDGAIESWLPGVSVIEGSGTTLGDIGVIHGHTWPRASVLSKATICLGHEHPHVRLTDDVGGRRIEPVWLRGTVPLDSFRQRFGELPFEEPPEFIVFPAFNDLVGGTWVNVPEQDFLTPWLSEASDLNAFLLDGTRLGPLERL